MQVDADDFADILATAREFIRKEVVPREQEIADTDAIPEDIRKKAAAIGLFGYAIPQEWGGLGLDLAQDVELAMEFGYTSLALRSMFGTNNGIAGQVLVGFGTDEQKAQWLERIASGDVVASFALTEPGAGSNPAGLRTKAVLDGSDWVIDGNKRFITNAPLAQLFVVFARTRPADSDGPGIAVFLVPADTPGVTVGPKDKKMGQEGAWTSEVTFDNVRVPESALVGGDQDTGYRAAMTSLARGRVHIAALSVKRFNNAGLKLTPSFITDKFTHFFKVKADDADTDLVITVKDEFGNEWTENMQRPKAFSTDAYRRK